MAFEAFEQINFREREKKMNIEFSCNFTCGKKIIKINQEIQMDFCLNELTNMEEYIVSKINNILIH